MFRSDRLLTKVRLLQQWVTLAQHTAICIGKFAKAAHPNPTYGAYWTTSVLSQQPNVRIITNPEWWGDNHGPYANSGNDTILWDFDPNSAGWSASGMEWQGFGYGTWIMDPAQGGEPWIVKDDLYYDNTQYWGVEIRMSSLADQGDNIFWKTTNEPFSGDKSIPLSVSPGTARPEPSQSAQMIIQSGCTLSLD